MVRLVELNVGIRGWGATHVAMSNITAISILIACVLRYPNASQWNYELLIFRMVLLFWGSEMIEDELSGTILLLFMIILAFK